MGAARLSSAGTTRGGGDKAALWSEDVGPWLPCVVSTRWWRLHGQQAREGGRLSGDREEEDASTAPGGVSAVPWM